jgi:hypothetical protein
MSHTPGPWKALLYAESVYVTAADCHIYSIDGKGKRYHPDTIKEWHANARLIAAAPEMLEALAFFLDDPKVDISIGGNPSYTEQRLAEIRDIYTKAIEAPVAG